MLRWSYTGKGRPGLFLASATLADATAFAAQLVGRSPRDFHHVDDGGSTEASEVSAIEVPNLIRNASKEDSFSALCSV